MSDTPSAEQPSSDNSVPQPPACNGDPAATNGHHGGAAGGGPLAAAQAYQAAGLSVIPIRCDGTKAPACRWEQYQQEPANKSQIREWFCGNNPPGVAVIGGGVSGGLECIDFDAGAENIFPVWCELVEAEEPGLLARLSVALTPKPGYHIRYRCPDIEVPGNTKLARDQAAKEILIETRGEGGYALAPGCPAECHPTGRMYLHHSGPPLEQVQVISIEERYLLIRCAMSFDREPPPEPPNPKAERGPGVSPGDDYDQHGPDWGTILEPRGWQRVRQHDGLTYWRRPGKDGPGWSGTTGLCSKAGRPLLCVFSNNAAPFPGPEGGRKCSSHGKFAAYTLLNHEGDFFAAARALAAEGYGERRPKRTKPPKGPPEQADSNERLAADGIGNNPPLSAPDGTPPTPYRIDASDENLAHLTAEAWCAIQRANSPPTLFRYGALLSRIETDDDGAPMLRPMTVDRLRHRLARDAFWFKLDRKDNEKPIAPPLSVVRDVLATPDPDIPILTRIVEAPIFARDGSLCADPGYNAASKTYYAPASGFTVPKIPEQPTVAEIKESRELLTLELLGDFPFVGEAERAHAVAAALGPFVRDMIDGPTPLHSFEAPSPGTGKTLLVDLLTYPALGRPIPAMTEGRDEDEWRKRIFAKLRTAPSTLLLDNIKRRLESGALASAITSYPLWEDRILGVSEVARVPVRCIWLSTGNNPALSSEMTRRTIRIRLDARVDRPWLREGFRHRDIRVWVSANRSRLVWAALTLIRAWIVAGRPEGKRTLGMFESWAKVMGGILDVAGIPGFLGNLEDFYEKSDAEGSAWRAFVASWWTLHSSKAVTVSVLWPVAIDAGLDLGDKSEQSQKIRLGKLLKDMRDRTFTIVVKQLRIDLDGTDHRANLWRLAEP
jgi:hypothetical protein